MIQLTTNRGPVLVNPLQMSHVRIADTGTKIMLIDGEHIIVNETPKEILALIVEWDRQ